MVIKVGFLVGVLVTEGIDVGEGESEATVAAGLQLVNKTMDMK